MLGPTPYKTDKMVPWNYGGEIYYHGVKQIEQIAEEESSEEDNPDISNIAGTRKITRSGRIFSPEIAPPTTVFGPAAIPKITPVTVPTSVPSNNDNTIPIYTSAAEKKGKNVQEESVLTKAHSLVIPETSQKEMEEILKIIKKSDYNMVEQLGQTPSKISMLALLLCSEAHAKALIIFLKTAHVPQETSVDQFEDCVASLTADNGLGFFVADLTPKERNTMMPCTCLSSARALLWPMF